MDSHKNTLSAAAVTAVGKPVSMIEAPNDDGGHELILAWAARLEGEPAWAIEASATFARVFVRRRSCSPIRPRRAASADSTAVREPRPVKGGTGNAG